MKIDIDLIWSRLKQHQGQDFYKVGGEAFTYSFIDGQFSPSCAKQLIGKGEFQKALNMYPFSKVSDISDKVRGGSYIFAVLKDPRIMQAN